MKIWTDLCTVLSQFTRVTDRQTDGRTNRQTDRILIARPRLHYMQRGKHVVIAIRRPSRSGLFLAKFARKLLLLSFRSKFHHSRSATPVLF